MQHKNKFDIGDFLYDSYMNEYVIDYGIFLKQHEANQNTAIVYWLDKSRLGTAYIGAETTMRKIELCENGLLFKSK